MSARAFASDNASGVHPDVLAAIVAANTGHTPAYGDDPWTAAATADFQRVFDCDAEVFFCFGGTGANVLGLAAVTRPYHAILCADSAHLWNSEGAAPERFLGAKIMPLPHRHGKLEPAAVTPHLAPGRGVHNALPRVLSITQPTEYGTLYTPGEIAALAELAHSNGMLLHVDGARFANAVAALKLPPHELGPGCGIDVLSFGGTKNGLLGAEAVVFFNHDLATEAAYARKQATQLASKMRFIAAQFSASFADDLWLQLAGHANTMAARLAAGAGAIEGVELVCPSPCNMVFPRLPRTALARLHEAFYFYTWDEADAVARWVTSFDTTPDDVDALLDATRAACAVT